MVRCCQAAAVVAGTIVIIASALRVVSSNLQNCQAGEACEHVRADGSQLVAV